MRLFSAFLRKTARWGVASAITVATGVLLLTAGSVNDVQAKKIVIKQTNIYVASLPTGCVKTMYGDVVVWRCGTLYYQPYKGRYVRVYIN